MMTDPMLPKIVAPAVPFDIRVFLVLCGLSFMAMGYAWRNGYPRHRSRYGLQFRIAMASAEIWTILHRRVGTLLVACGLWWILPFELLKDTLMIQIPIGSSGTILGVLVIKYLLEKRVEKG